MKLNKLVANANGTRTKINSFARIFKAKKGCGPLQKGDRELIRFGVKNPANQNILDIPEEVLNEMRQLNPRDVANILVNS